MSDTEGKLQAELRRGVIQVAALALTRRETYGYQIAKDLAEHGLVAEEGTLYPILRRLEEQGLVESTWNTKGSRPRKYYHITDAGERTLEGLMTTWRRIHDTLLEVVEQEKDA